MVDRFFCSLFMNPVGVKHLRYSLWEKTPDFIRKCFTLVYQRWDLIKLSPTDKQGEAFGYKYLGVSPNLSPKCFAPTGGKCDHLILSFTSNHNYHDNYHNNYHDNYHHNHPVGVKHLRYSLWGKTPDFIRKCFTLVYKLCHSLWGKIPDFIRKCFTLVYQRWDLIKLSLTDKQGEAFGYKILAFPHHIFPKCFALTDDKFDVNI